ncbi:MAG: hypothetical protein P8Z75_02120 [Gammaproteobacteria bacterium]|jgi:hypothetical protein
MSVLSQEIVDYLNRANRSLGDWLAENPVIRNLVTCPYVSIRPTALPYAQRITAFDGERGRFVDIYYRDGSHRYIINVSSWHLTIAGVETLAEDIHRAEGSCHVERCYLILYVPGGYSLEVAGTGTAPELRLRELQIEELDLF